MSKETSNQLVAKSSGGGISDNVPMRKLMARALRLAPTIHVPTAPSSPSAAFRMTPSQVRELELKNRSDELSRWVKKGLISHLPIISSSQGPMLAGHLDLAREELHRGQGESD